LFFSCLFVCILRECLLIKEIRLIDEETVYDYDATGNKIREIDAESKEKLFEYDVRDNLIKTTAVIDLDTPENNIVTVFEYNTDNKLIKQTDAEGKVIYYQYDSEGRLTKTIDGNGNEISMEYSDTDGSGCSSCSGGSVDQPSRVIYPHRMPRFFSFPFLTSTNPEKL